MATVYEMMKHNHQRKIREKGVATLLHPICPCTGEQPTAYALQFHYTDVVTAYPDGSVKLDSGGYNIPRVYNGQRAVPSNTTKERISRYLPDGYGIYQAKNKWWITRPNGETVEFKDGMTISPGEDRTIQENLDSYALANFYGMR